MAKDNAGTPGDDAGKDTGNDGKDTAKDTGEGQKLTADEVKKVLLGAGLKEDALQQLFDQAGSKVLNAHLEKQKAKDEEEAKKAAEKKRQKEIEKLEGVEREKAEAEEKLLQATEKEKALLQRECRAVLTARGYGSFPAGVIIDSEDAANKLADYLSSLKPAKNSGEPPPGKPRGSPTPKQKTEEVKMREKSFDRLSKSMHWLKKQKE
jgi:hypothetical protein